MAVEGYWNLTAVYGLVNKSNIAKSYDQIYANLGTNQLSEDLYA